MGARSCLYSGYYLITTLIFLALTIYQMVVILPLLPQCSSACGVAILQPLYVVGTSGGPCAPNLTDDQYYNAGCFECSATEGMVWPCPASSHVAGCGEASTRVASTCVGQNNATSVLGLPVVDPSSPGGDASRCAAALGTPTQSSNPSICSTCVSQGACISSSAFEGVGTFLDDVRIEMPGIFPVLAKTRFSKQHWAMFRSVSSVNVKFPIRLWFALLLDSTAALPSLCDHTPCLLQTGARNLCFTTPARISLRSALLPMMYILLGIYFLMTTCMLAQAVFLWCCFRKTTGRDWSKLGKFVRCCACSVRLVPHIIWAANVVFMILVIFCAVLFFRIGVCADALDSVGRPKLKQALSSSLVLAIVMMILLCGCGGAMRIYVNPDGALVDVPVLEASTVKESPDGSATSGGVAGKVKSCVGFVMKLGP